LCYNVINSINTPYIFVTVIFPQDLLENGILASQNYAMLGLGDIVIPGIFIAFLLRFDQRLVYT
jgi:minor histocompatibility antigen H13